MEPILRDGATHSDERLREIYGQHAVFSRVENITLVHIDSPSPETIERRTAEFDPRKYWTDDCPLCRYQREHGGHIVMGAGCEFEDDEPDGSDPDPEAGQSARELIMALDRLDSAADALICSLEPVANADLLRQAVEHVGFLHDRLLELAWSEDAHGRREALAGAVASAISTLSDIGLAHPELDDSRGCVDEALSAVAASLQEPQVSLQGE